MLINHSDGIVSLEVRGTEARSEGLKVEGRRWPGLKINRHDELFPELGCHRTIAA